jgi:hypothetical protein
MKPKTAQKAATKQARLVLQTHRQPRQLPESKFRFYKLQRPRALQFFFRQVPAKVAASACMAATLWSLGANGRAAA